MPIQSERGAVLVTGTSTGIGRATAFHLDQLGYQVFATVRSQADAEALCAEVSRRIQPIFMGVIEPVSIARARESIGRMLVLRAASMANTFDALWAAARL